MASFSMSSHSMSSLSDGQSQHSSSPSMLASRCFPIADCRIVPKRLSIYSSHPSGFSLTDVTEEEIDVAFSFPSGTSAQSILNQCKHNDTVCVITGSSNTSECKISGKLDNCCRTLHELLRGEMHRLKQCQSKTISVNNPTEWSQMVGNHGCINKAIRHISGAVVWINDADSFPKWCTIKGFPKQIQVAEELIERAKQGQGKELASRATAQNILTRLKRDLEDLCNFVFMD